MRRAALVTLFATLILLMFAGAAMAGPLPGAIFTTLEDGTRVNANIYQAKEDVYLDGGPGVQAPSKAAALPAGDYYFQVTDPSGKVLLSVDPIESRKIRVNEHGVIDMVYPALVETQYPAKKNGMMWGTHATGIDVDHADKGAITVQLMPYEDTPNPGGVYKVWVTPADKYSPGEGKHGFIPAWSKTDNFKVKGRPPCVPTEITVKKFHDLNANGVWDEGEPELNWDVEVTFPGGSSNVYKTPFTLINAEEGNHWFEELFPEKSEGCDPDWMQTALYLDGEAQPVNPKIEVWLEGCVFGVKSAITHEVVFGNIQTACVEAAKFYDKNVDGVWDEGEVPIEGWRVKLTGTNVRDEIVDMVAETDEYGKAKICGLLPGDYKIEELMPNGNWVATTPMYYEFSLEPGDCEYFEFGNVCFDYAAFGTKGFWHNKNGLALIQPAWIDYVNGLDPYKDNPFDGRDEYGDPVPAAKGPAGEEDAAAGMALAEISAYLVDSNAGGDPKIQLGQQLLAFIFNVKNTGAESIIGPEGAMSTEAMIASAVEAWNEGGAAANYWAGVLDCYNNMSGEGGGPMVKIVKSEPCVVEY
ncbi:MAG: hypothetical protein K0B85_06585 [Coriobacteriia bacterium]|nr:hypothetical protein [Coriobacteriia bacterium]